MPNPAPKWFTPVAILALLWNLFGCFAAFMDSTMTPEQVAKLTDAQRALRDAVPAWMPAMTIVGVVCGALGCLALLLRKKWATPLFILSLIGVIGQDVGLFTLSGVIEAYGMVPVILQSLVFAICVLLILLARKAAGAGWIE